MKYVTNKKQITGMQISYNAQYTEEVKQQSS